MQAAQAGIENGQLGDAAEIERHAAPAQEGPAGGRIQFQLTVVDQSALTLQFSGIGQQPGAARLEAPGLQRAHRHVELPCALAGQRLAGQQHLHQLRRHAHRHQAGGQIERAERAVGPVAAHHRGQALHLGEGALRGLCQLRLALLPSLSRFGKQIDTGAQKLARTAQTSGLQTGLQSRGPRGPAEQAAAESGPQASKGRARPSRRRAANPGCLFIASGHRLHLDSATMWSTAALTSSSLSVAPPPRAGIMPLAPVKPSSACL